MRIQMAVAVPVLLLAAVVSGQENHTQVKDRGDTKELNTQAYVELLRSDLKRQKEQIVKETMQLDEKQATLFWPLYREYDAALTKLGDEKLAIIQDYANNFTTMTNEKADQLAQRVMALDDQRLAVRKKYYDLMKKSLPATLAVRFFQVENQIQMLVDLQIASNLPIVEEAPGK